MTVEFQAAATRQGDLFAQNCITALGMAGFEIKTLRYRIPEVGIEIDAIANGSGGQAYAFEFKGSWNMSRPGAQRTDTAKKAIANGALFLCSEEAQIMPPIILMTSHMPDRGAGLQMIEAALRYGILLDVLTDRDGAALQCYSEAGAEQVEEKLRQRMQAAWDMGRISTLWQFSR